MARYWLTTWLLLTCMTPLPAQDDDLDADFPPKRPTASALGKALQGRWVLDTFELQGKVHKREEFDTQSKVLVGFNRIDFEEGELLLADQAPLQFRRWTFSVADLDEPMHFVMSCPEKRIQGTIYVSHLDEPARQVSLQFEEPQVKLNYARDETDPRWLGWQAKQLREMGGELLLEGNETQQRFARQMLQRDADSLQREQELRQRGLDFEREADELAQSGKQREAAQRRVEAEQAVVEADAERAERAALQRRYEVEGKQRDKVHELVMRAAALRREGAFDDAEEVETELKLMLRDRDPDVRRVNELKEQAAEARLEGRHPEAEEYDRQAAQLLDVLRQRYGADSDSSSRFNEGVSDAEEAVAEDAAAQVGPTKPNAPAESREIRVFQLQNSSAAETMRLLEKLGYSDERCSLACDVRLNALIASGSHDRLLEIEALLLRLDEKSDDNRDAPGASAARNRDAINTLMRDYEGAEENAAALARQWREERSKAKPNQQRLAKLADDVRRQTQNAFVLRQQLHQARINASRQELDQIEQRLHRREALAKEIIERRVSDLLHPEFHWRDEADLPPASPNSSTRTLNPFGAATPPDSFDPLGAAPPPIDGLISATSDEGLVELSIGSDDGVKRGRRLDVVRGATLVGRVEVTKTEPNKSVGRLVFGTDAAPIKVGDRVVSESIQRPAPKSQPGDDSAAVDQVHSLQGLNQVAAATDDGKASNETVQVSILEPQGVKIIWPTMRHDGKVAPAKANLAPGQKYLLRLEKIPGHADLTLQPTLEIRPLTDQTRAYTRHNSIPLQFTQEDFDQAEAGNLVTKVVYLPSPEFAEVVIAGVETLVATRLEPGVDPVAEAERRGNVLTVLRLGNRQKSSTVDGAAP